jgi:hypothetical protein
MCDRAGVADAAQDLRETGRKKESSRRGVGAFIFCFGARLEPRPKTSGVTFDQVPSAQSHDCRRGRRVEGSLRGVTSSWSWTSSSSTSSRSTFSLWLSSPWRFDLLSMKTNLVPAKKSVNKFFVNGFYFFTLDAAARVIGQPLRGSLVICHWSVADR